MSEKSSISQHEALFVDEHIVLRAVTEEEAERLFYITDQSREYLAEYLPWVRYVNSSTDSLDFIKKTRGERAEGSQFGFGIYVEGRLVGHISLMHVTDEQSPEIGYWIAKEFSGRGVTTGAADAVTKFGFDVLGLRSIVIKAAVDNTGSNKIAQKLGYELSGTEQSDNDTTINIWRKTNER